YEHRETEIRRYVKVKGNASPYDGNLVYWSSRMGTHPEMPTEISKLLRFFVTWYGSIGGHKSTKSLSGKRLN
ncbi:MAG: hypothetical protein ACKPKR_27190, partial [Microcystis panniformis]